MRFSCVKIAFQRKGQNYCFVIACVIGNGGEQLVLLAKERKQKRGEWGGQYISFYRPPLGPTLGQQNLDRRRFDLLGNRETPTHQCVFHMESTCNDNNIAKYLFHNMKYQNPQESYLFEISKRIVLSLLCASFTSILIKMILKEWYVGYVVEQKNEQEPPYSDGTSRCC